MRAIFATSVAAAFAATSIYHARQVHKAVSWVPVKQIYSSLQAPQSLVNSAAAKITNPRGQTPIQDTRFTTVDLSGSPSDEDILSRFVKGFYGGYVLAPEATFLKWIVGKEFTRFEALKDESVSLSIWSASEISRNKLPPIGALLFGVFRITDMHVENQAPRQTPSQNQSYVDFVFGQDDGFIAGVHRFSVSRVDSKEESEERHADSTTKFRIEYAHLGCNPTENRLSKSAFLLQLHLWYAMLLFREGVAEVLKG